MRLVGVDAGGTTTRAVLVDGSGTVLGRGAAGPGNPVSAGRDRAVSSVAEAFWLASGGAAVDVVAVAMAGVLTAPIDEVWLATSLGVRRCVVASDVLGAYLSGSSEHNGGVLVVGTGAVGGVVLAGELVLLRDGLGWLAGDSGAGAWIGQSAVRAVAAALDGRGPNTALVEPVLAGLPVGVAGVLDRDPRLVALLADVYTRSPVEVARHARAVIVAAAAGDLVASRIVDEAGRLLADTVSSLWVDSNHPFVLAGGLVGHGGPLTDAVLAGLGRPAVLAGDGLVGAAVLALHAAGVEVDNDVRTRVVTGLS